MPDFFETDEVTKGFDAAISRRIFGYLRPYGRLALAALLALAVVTATELYVPILVRGTVDEALVARRHGVDPALAARPEGAAILGEGAGGLPAAGGRLWVEAKALGRISTAQRRELEAAGLLDPAPRYLAALDPADPGRAAVVSRLAAEGAALLGDSWAAIEPSALGRLSDAEARALRGADLKVVSRNVFILVAVLVLSFAANFIQAWLSNLIGQRVMKDLRMDLFRHVSTRSISFLSRQPVGRLVTRMTSDVETINQFFTDVVAAFLKDGVLMAGVLVVLFALDLRLALVTLATLPPIAIVTVLSRARARDAFRRQRTWLSKVNAYLAERISGINVVKLFAGEERARREFKERNRELLRATLGEMYVFATFRPVIDLFSSASVAVVIWYGAGMHRSGALSLGTLIAFINLIRMFYSPVLDLSEKYTILQSAMAGGERVFKLLDALDEIPDTGKRAMPAAIRGHLEFDRVGFAYKEGEWVLRGLSFNVEPGEMVAIVGYTGAGKTTIANLLPRLWDVQEGEIRVDGHPVRELPLDGLRRAIQPVPQDVFLFSGSIEENIRLGEEVSVERMRLAARAVHADEFIDRLPEGYGTRLAEGATNLSMGQRQLLSFARVLAHDPAVIILDEATSSVDTETERMIQRGLEGLLQGRTSVVIAHRLSTIRHADRIIVLSHGMVAEQGRHEELMERKGLYWNLHQLQHGGGLGDA